MFTSQPAHSSEPGSSSKPPTHLYEHVEAELRRRICGGDFAVGARLPTERALALEFGVSLITCKHALKILADEGLIERWPGRGTVVAKIPSSAPITGSLDGLLEAILLQSYNREYRLMEFSYVPAPAAVVEAFGVAPEAVMQKAVTLGMRGDQKSAYVTTYVPEHIGRTYSKEDILRAPRILLLMRNGGVRIGRAEQTIGSAPASRDVAKALGVKVGSPVLTLLRLVFDDQGRGVEYVETYFPWNSFSYRMVLSGSAASPSPATAK